MIEYLKQLRSTFAYIKEHYGTATALAALVSEVGSLLAGAAGWVSTQVGRAAAAPGKAWAWLKAAPARAKVALLSAELAAYRLWLAFVAELVRLRVRWAAWRDDHPAVDFALWLALSCAVTALAFWLGVVLTSAV